MARDMDRWLGDGGMAVIGELGGSFDAYGEGWAEAAWTPTALACNPQGIVQAGVHSVLLDAAMNFAMLASLDKGDRGATLEMKTSTMRPAQAGDALRVRGEVTRLARQVAYTEAWVRNGDGEVVAHSTGTFIVRRAEPR
ncbi:MAG TPA: PaaI family thioesterase [Acidimicrobiia bacterium]|nr:PaaI family thioesterase [Acidimicrobiia bacterium]